MSHHRHVVPVNDIVEHETSERCVCGPTTEPVERDDGSIAWLHVHHSLDGREMREDRARRKAGQ